MFIKPFRLNSLACPLCSLCIRIGKYLNNEIYTSKQFGESEQSDIVYDLFT